MGIFDFRLTIDDLAPVRWSFTEGNEENGGWRRDALVA
jgi:hypothetical protein